MKFGEKSKLVEVCELIYLLKPSFAPFPGWQAPNLYLLGKKEPVLVDAGYAGEEAFQELKELILAGNPKLLILTHGHLDHSGGAILVKERLGIKICAHKDEAHILEKRAKGIKIERWLEDGDQIETELGLLKVVHTPGHSPGHICLLYEDKKWLFSGDLIVGQGTSLVGPPDGDMSLYLASLRRINSMGLEKIFPGHGPLITSPERHIKELIEHREIRELQILKMLERGPSSVKELMERIYAGFIHPALYQAAEVTILGHLNKLISEGKVSCEPRQGEPFEKRYFLMCET